MKKVVWGAFSVIVVIVCTVCSTSLNQYEPTPINHLREQVITMQVTIQVSADVAHVLHQQGPDTAESEALFRVVNTLGYTLEPMHPNTDDPNLQSYFIVEVPDSAAAQHLIDSLQQLEAVEAAYVKPPDELP